MPKRRFIKFGLVLALALAVFGGGYVAGQQHALAVAGKLNVAELNEVYTLLHQKFDGGIDDSKLADGAKSGLVAATGDPYTVYLDAKSAKALDNDLAGTLSGIGAEVGIKGGKLVVIAPLDDSPAAKAGLRAKDVIARIDGVDTSGLTLDEAVGKIRGAKGTKVKLLIVRGSAAPMEIEITRDEITVPSVKSSLPKPGIGLIKISRFGSDTGGLVSQAAADLKGKGATKIILDLRDDPGGYLDAAVKVGSDFAARGQLIVEERHAGKSIDKLDSTGSGELAGWPTVVLINGGSASASEILAGALQDHHLAQIVGEKSFGKGSVQEVIKLSHGAELKVTVAHWYTPNGKNISKEGIQPDIEVKLETADADAGRDPQLDKAFELLSK